MTEQVRLIDDEVVLDFPYHAEQVAQVKSIPGAKWDRLARVWRVPATQLDAARTFAFKHGFTMHPDVENFDMPANPAGHARVETLTTKSGGFLLLFPYDTVRVKAVKEVPGAVWDTKRKAWRVPATSLPQVIEFAERFGLTVPAEVKETQASVVAQQKHMLTLSNAHDADLDTSWLAEPLYAYQKAAVLYALEARRCFIADDMGLGKTRTSLAAIERSERDSKPAYPALIVCPASLLLNWRNEISQVLPQRTVKLVKGRSKFPEEPADYTVVSWANISAQKERLKGFRSVVFDESHAAKNEKAARTKAALVIAKSVDGLVLCLTGTPITNRPIEYASQLALLGQLGDFGGRFPFARRYANAFQDRWGHWHLDGHSNLEELNERLRATCYVRRTKGEVLTQLPPIQHTRLVVEPDSTAMIEYRKAECDIATYVAQRASELALELGQSPKSAAVKARLKAESAKFLVQIATLRRLAALAKMSAIEEWLDARVEEGIKTVVFTHHREITLRLAQKYGGLSIIGGMSVEAVEEAKHKFQTQSAADAPVIVVSLQAGGQGHTLTASSNALFVELPWTWAACDQAISRLHRLGQKDSVQATYLLAADTIDENIFDLLEVKHRVVTEATEGCYDDDQDAFGQLVSIFIKKGTEGTTA